MKAWTVSNNKIKLTQLEIPKVVKGHKLLKVTAFGINRADLLQIEGKYEAPDGSAIPGLEVAGTLVETGEEVCALVSSGAYAEYVLVPEKQIIPIPKNYGVIEAAALPEALITVGMNLFQIAKVNKKKNVLIHGGTSGIGSFARKLCKALGAKVFTSVGSDEKIATCAEADVVFNYNSDWVDEIKKRGGIDVILDILAGNQLEKNISALNYNGILCSIAVMSGSKCNINMASVLMKNLRIVGSTLRSKSLSEKAATIKFCLKKLMPLIESQNIKPTIDSSYRFIDVLKAHERMKSRQHNGKIVVVLND